MMQVQVNHGAWGFVCDDHFDQDDNGAEVICKRLGWAGPVGSATHCDANVGTDEFALDDLVRPGPVRIAALHHRPSPSHQTFEYIRCASISAATMRPNPRSAPTGSPHSRSATRRPRRTAGRA